MGDANAYGQEEAVPGGPRMPTQYKFSQDELHVIQECNAESFFQRSLPIGTALGLGALFGVQKGHLKPNPRFGAFPKVTLAVIMGYFIGKLSYQKVCAEKLMALPNSYIGHLLREKKAGRGGISGSTQFPTSQRAPTMFGATSNDVYSDAGPGSALNLDTDRPLFNDDSFRPGTESGTLPNSPDVAPSKPVMSYDELRSRNRGEYTETRQDPYRVDPNTVPPISRAKPGQPQTNQYGDVME